MTDAITPRSIRWTVRLLSIVILFLFGGLLTFVLDDIDDIRGPLRQNFESQQVEAGLVDHIQELQQKTKGMKLAVGRQEEIQENLRSSMAVAQETMEQMTGLHRLSLERDLAPSEEQVRALSEAQTRFIKAQENFEAANQSIADLNTQLHTTESKLAAAKVKFSLQQRPGRRAWEDAWNQHTFMVAIYKLSFIIPVFLFAAWVVGKKRKSTYRSIHIALLVAAFWHLGTVMHEHFPSDFFKYIAIAAGILIVLFFLMRMLQNMNAPQPDALLRRRREAYCKHLCAECGYPFPADHSTAHHCPSCGTGLFEACHGCGQSRHSLLPHCEHCGS
jgi:predicted RNA-binding Zn-ribbon protein involved in translation (DUF1610 family)